MDQIKTDRPRPLQRRVPFAVTAPRAARVAVTGDFTQWSQEGIALRKASNGQWGAVLSLPPGEYQYRLLIDGEWCDDPMAKKQAPNAFGGSNGILEVRDR